jgi:hypothetical protein
MMAAPAVQVNVFTGQPRNGEPELRFAMPTAYANFFSGGFPPPVNMLNWYKSRIGLTCLRSGKDALSYVDVSMPLKTFAEL